MSRVGAAKDRWCVRTIPSIRKKGVNILPIDWTNLLAGVVPYAVPVLKALAILVVGWMVAWLLSRAIKKLLDKTDLDNRLAEKLTGGRSKKIDIETGVSRFIYWLVLLFALVGAFQSLGLTMVTEPLNTLLTKITGFVPQILAAIALTAVAWMVATLLRTVVTNLLSSFQLDDKLSESAGEETKKLSLANTLGDAVYYLIFLIFLPQILDALQMEGLSPVRDMVGEILGFLPNVFGALAIFLIFYLVARIVQRLAANLLATIGFDKLPEILGLNKPKEDTPTASTLAGYIVLTVILFIGTVQAFNTLDLEIVSNLANELLQGLFKILVAGVIFAVGLFLSNLAHKAIVASGQEHAKTLAIVARVAILIFTGAMALYRTDLAPEIVNHAFTALIFGLAIAGALAFGLGGRDAAARTIEGWTTTRE